MFRITKFDSGITTAITVDVGTKLIHRMAIAYIYRGEDNKASYDRAVAVMGEFATLMKADFTWDTVNNNKILAELLEAFLAKLTDGTIKSVLTTSAMHFMIGRGWRARNLGRQGYDVLIKSGGGDD